jgi:membrane protein DedA with SNARE-associated domain
MQILILPFALIVVGGIISLAAVVEPHHRRSAPRVGFPMFCAGVFSVLFGFGLAPFIDLLTSDHELEFLLFVGGFLLGMIVGASLGYVLALRHKRHLLNPLMEADDGIHSK